MRRRVAEVVLVVLSAAVLTLVRGPAAGVAQEPPDDPFLPPPSEALGKPWKGRLVNGVQLPAQGEGFLSYDLLLRRVPDRPERRWGTQELVDVLQDVAAAWSFDHPDRPPLLIADLSRPRGGPFGKRYGGLGHASHQNGLDADVPYPRKDRRIAAATRPSQVDRVLAQELIDRFVEAGAQKLFVGLHLGLKGPKGVVSAIPFHDDHVHVRIANPATGR